MIHSFTRLTRFSLAWGLAFALMCGIVAMLETMPQVQARMPVPSAGSTAVHASAPIGICTDTFSIIPGTLMTLTAHFNGVDRPVSFYLPTSYQPTQTLPLWFALHGGAQDASAMFAPSKHITTWAEAENFIAVFPNGLPRASAPPTSTNYFWTDDVNVPYLNYVMDVLMVNAAIDRQRVYVIGFSAGANMTYRLAADRSTSQRIAAIATVAGHVGGKQALPTASWQNTDPLLNDAWPTSALFLQGEKDEAHPVLGGFTADNSAIIQAFQTKVDLWRLSIGQLSGVGITLSLPYAPGRVIAHSTRMPARAMRSWRQLIPLWLMPGPTGISWARSGLSSSRFRYGRGRLAFICHWCCADVRRSTLKEPVTTMMLIST